MDSSTMYIILYKRKAIQSQLFNPLQSFNLCLSHRSHKVGRYQIKSNPLVSAIQKKNPPLSSSSSLSLLFHPICLIPFQSINQSITSASASTFLPPSSAQTLLSSRVLKGGIHITTQIQQSHSSSPQSHPKHGLVVPLMGFLMDEEPEEEEGRTASTGSEI